MAISQTSLPTDDTPQVPTGAPGCRKAHGLSRTSRCSEVVARRRVRRASTKGGQFAIRGRVWILWCERPSPQHMVSRNNAFCETRNGFGLPPRARPLTLRASCFWFVLGGSGLLDLRREFEFLSRVPATRSWLRTGLRGLFKALPQADPDVKESPYGHGYRFRASGCHATRRQGRHF
jgi:hypothetical protein